jgi:hypothetical protein
MDDDGGPGSMSSGARRRRTVESGDGGSKGPEQTHQDVDQRATIARLEQRIDDLVAILGSVKGYEEANDTLTDGLSKLADKLNPLVELVPVRTGDYPHKDVVEAVFAMRDGLARPRWTDAGMLTVPQPQRVFLIGDVARSPYFSKPRPGGPERGKSGS